MPVLDQNIEQQRNQELIDHAEDRGVEVGVFMLLDQHPSGFIQEGTENQPNPPQLMNPVARRILNKSAYAVWTKGDGGKAKTYKRVATEYVASAQDIEVSKLGDAVRNPNTDFIEFRQGMVVVVGEGASLNKLQFLRKNSYNATSKDRIPGVEAIYKEIFPEKEKEADISFDLALGKAMTYIRETFIQSETTKGYVYDDNKLLAFCQLFSVGGDTSASRLQALIATAKAAPKAFLDKARLFEERIYLQIAHGEQLGIIRFNDTSIEYVNREKVLITFSKALTKDDKVKQLASFFMSAAGREEYNIYLTELEFKGQDSLKTN